MTRETHHWDFDIEEKDMDEETRELNMIYDNDEMIDEGDIDYEGDED